MPFRIPRDAPLIWKFISILIWLVRPFCCKLQVDGLENIPETGGAVLACNHSMGPDYLVLGYVSPRQVHYMAKSELFDINAQLSKFFLKMGGIPVKRGQRDGTALDAAVEVVKSGHVLGMFPEGTRSRTGQLQTGKSGAIRIAKAADVPLVPAVVLNAETMVRGFVRWHKPTVRVRFGKPLRFDAAADPASLNRQLHAMMAAIAELLPMEQRGVYADGAAPSAGAVSPDEIVSG